MPRAAVLLGTGLVSAAQYPYSITVGGVEVAPTLAELDSLEFQDSGDDSPGRLVARIWDSANAITIVEQGIVIVNELSSNQQVFLGIVQRRRYDPAAVGRWIEVEALSVGWLLDETIIERETRPVESDRARVLYLWGKYARWPLSGDGSQVASTNGAIAATDLLNMTLRQALRETAALAGSTLRSYVDPLGRIHWFAGAESNPAPFNINVANPPGGGNIAPTDLRIERDGMLKNRAYVRGATEAGSGWFQDDASVAAYGPRETLIDAPSSDTAAKAQSIARLYFGRVAQPRTRGVFSTQDPNNGWRAGQYTTVTDPHNGLTAESMRIARVTTKFLKGTGTKRYVCELGSVRPRGSDIEFEGESSVAPSSIASDVISSGGDAIPASAIVVKDAGGTSRVTLGALGSGDYGLRVTSSDGATVIIDGTSNMFKIAATGTTSVTGADDTLTTTSTTLTALGSSYTSTPASAMFVSPDASLGFAFLRTYGLDLAVWVSATSGGATDQKRIVFTDLADLYCRITAGQVVVSLRLKNHSGASNTRYGRYYILKEVAL